MRLVPVCQGFNRAFWEEYGETPSTVFGINIVVNLIFGIMYLACLIPLMLYPLNETEVDAIRERLEQRHSDAE